MRAHSPAPSCPFCGFVYPVQSREVETVAGELVKLDDDTGFGREIERGELNEVIHYRVREMLGSHYPQYLDPAVDARIRERFPIRLDPADMRAGNGRW